MTALTKPKAQSASPKTILVADDDLSIRTVLAHALRRAGYQVELTDNGATLYEWISQGRGDLVITDVMMPGENGLDLLPKIRRRRPDLKVIVISAQNMLTTAVRAAEQGAAEFLPKPFDIDAVIETVKTALTPLAKSNAAAVETASAMDRTFVVGESPVLQDIYRTIARLRDSTLTVLITGESGTGKEVIARALHAYSPAAKGPFVAVNMAALPRELIESDLFGHEKGAFTGATQKTTGRFEQAAGGTLFLDEIGDMPMEAQTRLLRVLQEGEFTAVGGRKAIKSHARIIAATHQDIKTLIRAGRFREDLYYRLNVVPLQVPPLRARVSDIPLFVRHFARNSDKVFNAKAMEALQSYAWRGNVREMENFVSRLVALHAGDVIDGAAIEKAMLDFKSGEVETTSNAEAGSAIADIVNRHCAEIGDITSQTRLYEDMLSMLEKPLISEVLSRTRGNQIKAAEILGLNRNTLRKKIRDLEIVIKKGGNLS